MTTQPERSEPLIDVARTSATAAEARRLALLEKIETQDRELRTIALSIARAVDADELERLTARRSALRTVSARARAEVKDTEQKVRELKARLSGLENEAIRIRAQLGASEDHPAWTQASAETLKASEDRAVKSLADLTGKPHDRLATFVASYLRLATGDERKAAVIEFFGIWDRALHTILSDLMNDYAAVRRRKTEHTRKIETDIARLVKLTGPIDLDALRREYRQQQLIAALDPKAETERQQSFKAALTSAEQAVLEATQQRDAVQQTMRDHAITRKAQEQELLRLSAQSAQSKKGAEVFPE